MNSNIQDKVLMVEKSNSIIKDKVEFLAYLKTRTELYHLSNVFFRDFQYGITSFALSRGIKLRYDQTEKLASELIEYFVEQGILKYIKPGSWMLNYPSFRKPAATKTSAAKSTDSGAEGRTPTPAGETASASPAL